MGLIVYTSQIDESSQDYSQVFFYSVASHIEQQIKKKLMEKSKQYS